MAAASVTDLQSKYSKLAQEYSKLRAQNQVLKKAVLDEQSSSASLKEELQQRDQSLRKLQQETESLNFRNQQLMKRVELLQEERRNKVEPPLRHQAQSVFDEDLQKKILENERLHIQFLEAEARLVELQSVCDRHQATVDALSQEHTLSLEKLQSDKHSLQLKLETLERDVQESRARAQLSQQTLQQCQMELEHQSKLKVQERVFDDSQLSDYNCLNVPPHDRRQQLRVCDVSSQALLLLQELVSSLLNTHSYTEQRTHAYPRDSCMETVSPSNQKFSQYLCESAVLLCRLEEDLQHLHRTISEHLAPAHPETLAKMQNISTSFSAYNRFLQKILPYQITSLEEECEAPLCSPTLCSINRRLQTALKKLTSAFDKLGTYLRVLLLPSVCESSVSGVFRRMSECLHELHLICSGVCDLFSQKVSLEQNLPGVAQKLHTTNQCLERALGELTRCSRKMSEFFKSNLAFLCSSAEVYICVRPLQMEVLLQGRNQAVEYVSKIRKVRSESVPFREALSDRQVLMSSTQSREGLMQQEREHWLLEAQLAQVRLQRGSQEEQGSLGDEGPRCDPVVNHVRSEAEAAEASEKLQDSSVLGVLTVSPCAQNDADPREQLIHSHFLSRVCELSAELQMSESRATHFHAECRAVCRRLSMAEKTRLGLTEELKQATHAISGLQDELSTTKRSYEDQLSMMSEHLCSLNDTLSKQREEIDALQLTNKGTSKKNKSR
ncbi:hypothetical protein DNTS_027657 [Danionella cerebrum]|uniref:Protein phosphatase 1 regulatory subunit 21 n=1 Tax=Danionella cerebrum TaxID=2873325 RepID=A0A553QG56_9TELE|nr:hypothetical protein DNTS_027657 [Danionella translucida]